jgi:hypothetical protein
MVDVLGLMVDGKIHYLENEVFKVSLTSKVNH